MSSTAIGITGLAALAVLFALRVPVGLALIGVSGLGLWQLLSARAAWGLLQSVPYQFTASWTLSAVPMFLFMGYICFYSGMTTSLFELAKALLSRLPGALAISSVAACSAFASVCGSSIACAAAMGRIAIPEMVRAGYDRNIACGVVAAGGTIGALIPPSIVLILFGIFAQTSIIQLFLGGIGMGLATALGYSLVIVAISWLRPNLIPRRAAAVAPGALMANLRQMGPLVLLLLGVFGGLFGGIFTTTEAGAVGATMAFVIAVAQGRFSRTMMVKAMTETVITCGSLFIIGVGATMLTRFVSISGAGDLISSMVIGWDLTYWQFMLLVMVVYLILGTFMDGIGAMLLTLPIFLPIVEAQNINLVLFGVLIAKLIEIGMLTPPFGLNVFVIKSVVGNLTSLTGVFRGVTTFIAIDIAVVLLCIAVPAIVMFFPTLMS
ncbi:MAG TPA: TRAP transporter large permease subunit [Rhizobiaceae bacterium]|nr:TRAP transporter large permease subunit [Rhizobiaceae bacterium]